jgi:N-acetylmuramoyl-L-alanine amidase/AmpD protein
VLAALLIVAAGAGAVAIRRALLHRARVAAVNRAYPRVPSPNYDRRPWPTRVDCVVVHATAGDSLAEAVAILTDPSAPARVSAHFVVGRDGTVVQLVPIEERAWHAGVSSIDGRPDVNRYSVGIEVVNRNDGRDPFTPAQYRAVAGIVRRLRTCYDLPDERIVSHAGVALPRGRKSDPLGFDFARLRRLAR